MVLNLDISSSCWDFKSQIVKTNNVTSKSINDGWDSGISINPFETPISNLLTVAKKV